MDIENKTSGTKKKIKTWVLIGVNIVMFLIVSSFWNSQGAIINTIFTISGYTSGSRVGYMTH